MPEKLRNTDRLCLHTVTTKPWKIETAIEEYARAGVKGISIWREAVEGRERAAVRRRLADAGLTGVSYVRGGFFPSADPAKRQSALEDNRAIIREAAELGLPLIVLVCGADPNQSLELSRRQITDALGILAPEAEEAGVLLGIEPLHPMYADTRSAVNTLAQANDIAEAVGHPAVQVVVDVYHLWWDPLLGAEIARSGASGRLAAFHVCDWKVPTEELLLDRGLMG
ncbi:MAG: sugar phosphate isomerase/epimerase family protein, partial [Spirochaetaceae bacterium]